jgi:site-specific DNA-methyltransferase (adenine-specific)
MIWELRTGDCVALMAELDECSIDAIVTDPPYGLEFMGQEWDRLGDKLAGSVTGAAIQGWHEAWAQEALRILKPGGHLLAFGGTRTYHRLAAGIEDAGFEVRDMLDWLYGQGFPKSRDLGDGWGTALKPAHEPICMARKPLDGTTTANHARWSVGGLNIDGSRIEVGDADYARNHSGDRGHDGTRTLEERRSTDMRMGGGSASDAGRWPPNVAIDEEAAAMLDEQTGPQVSGGTPPSRPRDKTRDVYGAFHGQENPNGIGRSAGAVSRFFYCPKADRTERDVGLGADFDLQPLLWSSGVQSPGTFQSEGTRKEARNNHPTVKPIALMRWLCRLVTPAGGLVLDPFTGSGTTGIAALAEGFRFLGFEQDARWVEIARARISAGAGVSV